MCLQLYHTGSAPLDNYNQPVLADSSWFRGLDGLVKEVLVWGGGGEVLIDSIDDIANKLKEAHPKTEYIVQVSKVLSYVVSTLKLLKYCLLRIV